MSFEDPKAANARGRARQAELAAENAVAVRELVAGLLQGLDRPATTADMVLAEAIASAAVRGRRLRATGRDDANERRQVAALLKDSPFAPRVAEPGAARQAAEMSA